MILDTTADNPDMNSFYEADRSESAKPILSSDNAIQNVGVDMGSYSINGEKYTDKLCLIQNTNTRNDKTGKLCVPNLNFVVGKTLIGSLESSGIVGLAPGHGNTSIVQQLYDSNAIQSKIVALNYENPADVSKDSKITFGFIEPHLVVDNVIGIKYYQNLAVGKWGLLMDDFMYDGKDMTAHMDAKIGFIDSGNTTI